MAKVTSKILNLPEFKAKLATSVSRGLITNRIESFRSEAQLLIGQAVGDSFRQTVLYTGLIGGYTGIFHLDVLAHLGLTSDEGLQTASAIEDALFESIEISKIRYRDARGRFSGPSTGASAAFTITFSNLIDLIISKVPDNGTRESKRGSVPWLEWLISGGQVSGYNILYDSSGSRLVKASRSGNAIMTPRSTSWDINAFEKFAEGDNFIDDIFSNINFQQEVSDIIRRELANV